jgi:diguanylate cyclase (GGDEF)-like protein/PAS domain S-box-containing protein
MDLFSLYVISATLSAAVAVSVSVLAVVRRSLRSGAALIAVSFAVAIHLAAGAVMQGASSAHGVPARILCAAAFLVAAAVYQFVVTTLDGTHRHRIAALISWGVAVQLAVLAPATDYGPGPVRTFSWGVFPSLHRSAQWIYPLFFAAVLIATGLAVRNDHATAIRGDRIRRRLFLIALSIGAVALVDLLPGYGLDVHPLGWATLPVAMTLVFVAVTKYGLPAAAYPVPAALIIDSMRDLLVVTDRDGVIRFANDTARTFLADDELPVIGRRLEHLFASNGEGQTVLPGAWVRDRESIFRTKMGQPIELTLSYSPITTRQGQLSGAVIIGRDLRDRKRYEWEARRAVTLLQSTLDSTADGILVIMQDGRILTWNQRFADMWAVPAELMESDDESGLIGRIVQQVVDPGGFLDSLAALSEHPDEESMHILRLKDGRRFEQYSIGRRLDDQPVRVWSFRDITARLDAEEQIQFQAYHDALTQLPNRRLFVERLETSLDSAKRSGSCLAVLFMDLDHFKTINDTLGHDVADAVLVEIGARLRSCVAQTEMAARHGGDEFTILLPELDQADEATAVAKRILERVLAPVVIGSASIEVSASIGIAVYPDDGADIETLLRNADDAMYRAKIAGRNNYQLCTTQVKARAVERSSMQARLRKSIDDGRLALAYEPQVSLATGRIVGAEAILRWNDPERGMVEARDFLPLAEETRLIGPIGEWALFSVCQQLRRWIDDGLTPVRIGLDVSLQLLQRSDLAGIVRRAVDGSSIDPLLLELEIDETAALRDLTASTELLRRVRDAGVSVTLDDFGSDYSSLRPLATLPIQAVKLDRGLTAGVGAGEIRAIVGAVIGVAERLNLRVGVKGVETREQFECLRDLGCQEGQGPFLGATVDCDAFAALVSDPDRARVTVRD